VNVDSYASAQDFLRTLQKSIRPIKVGKLEINGGGNQLTLTVTATSYYQAEKGLTITKEEVE
jgi:hypothetical protein